jgi:hypothetical protein
MLKRINHENLDTLTEGEVVTFVHRLNYRYTGPLHIIPNAHNPGQFTVGVPGFSTNMGGSYSHNFLYLEVEDQA